MNGNQLAGVISMLPAVVDDVGDLQLGRAKLVISRTWKNCDLNRKRDIVSNNKSRLVV